MKKNNEFSHVHNNVVFVANQMSAAPADFVEETYHTLKQIENDLHSNNSSKDSVLKVNIYVPNMDCWQSIEKAYQNFFGAIQPANTIIPTSNEMTSISFEVIAEKNVYYAC